MTYYFKHLDGSLTQCGERNHAILSQDKDWQEITETEYNAIVNPPLTQEQIEQQHLNELRAKREPLLKAFDIYKSNVAYGVIVENYELHQTIIEWYTSILNLEAMALDNVPKVIEQYVVGGSE